MWRTILNCRNVLPNTASDELSEALCASCYLHLGPHGSPLTPLVGQMTHKPLPDLPFEKENVEEETAGSRLILGRYLITFPGGQALTMPNWKPNSLLATQILLKTMVSLRPMNQSQFTHIT